MNSSEYMVSSRRETVFKISLILLLYCIPLSAQNFFPMNLNNKYQTYGLSWGHIQGMGDYYFNKWRQYGIKKDTIIDGKVFYQFDGDSPFIGLNPLYSSNYYFRFDEREQKLFVITNYDDTVRLAADMNIPSGETFLSYIAGIPLQFNSLGQQPVVVFGDTVLSFGMSYTDTVNYTRRHKFIFAEKLGILIYDEMKSQFPNIFCKTDTLKAAIIGSNIYNPIYVNIDSLYPIINLPTNMVEPFLLHGKYTTSQYVGIDTFYIDVLQIRGDSVFKTYSFPFSQGKSIYLAVWPRSPGDTLKIKAHVKETSIFQDTDVWPDSGYAIIVLLPPTTDVHDESTNYNFKLYQNYPNPFNPVTKVSYEIVKPGKISLIIYNVLGKEVQVLVDEEQDSGFYEVEFNGSYLPSGVYFYKLQSEYNFMVKSMVLVK